MFNQWFEELDSPGSFELMYHSANHDSFACARSEVYELTTSLIEGIMPAVRIFIFIVYLDPFERFENGFKFDFTISEIDCFPTFFISFFSTVFL